VAVRGHELASPTVLFGGPHSYQPSFQRATVQPGDLIYLIGVRSQVLYVFGRMRVKEIIAVGGDPRPRLEQYFARYAEWRFLASTCTYTYTYSWRTTWFSPRTPLRASAAAWRWKRAWPRCR
jgi:hypothetical protein